MSLRWCDGYVEDLRGTLSEPERKANPTNLDWDALSFAYALGYPYGGRTGEGWNARERWPRTAGASDTIRANVS